MLVLKHDEAANNIQKTYQMQLDQLKFSGG